MDLWRRMIKAASMAVAMTKFSGCLNIAIYIGKETQAKIEARETIRAAAKTTAQVKRVKPRMGLSTAEVTDKASSTPKVQATPLPPLNFRKTVQT